MIKKRNKSGFSLLETLIGSAIFIVVLGIMTNFTFNFTAYSNRLSQTSDLDDSLRLTNIRIIKEIEQCSAVLSSYTAPNSTYGTALDGTITFVTTNTTAGSVMILTRKVVNKTTYVPYSNDSQNTSLNDVIIIKYDSATGKMIFSLIPATMAIILITDRSIPIRKSVLNSSLILNADDSSYIPFVFYKYSGSTPESNLKLVSMVVLKLKGKKVYGNYVLNKNTEEKISLRNFSA